MAKPKGPDIHQLQDVDVVTVGLVSQGANGEEFFLMKSDQGGNMPSTEETKKDGAIEGAGEGTPADEAGFWTKLAETFRNVLSATPQQTEKALDPEADKALKQAVAILTAAKDKLPPAGTKALQMLQGLMGMAAGGAAGAGAAPEGAGAGAGAGAAASGDGYPAPGAQMKSAGVSDVGKAATDPAVTIQLEALAKANQTLQTRLDAAEQAATAERDARALSDLVQKARDLGAVSTKPEELAEQLAFITKSDPKRAAWWESVLQALNKQLVDGGLFKEAGTSQSPVIKSTEQKVNEAIAKGQSPRDILLGLDDKDAQEYLDQQHAEMHAS